MYADDITLVSNSPIMLQATLNIVFDYARRWQYQLNSLKSLVMVIGESAAVRQRECMTRVWKLGESVISEVDEQDHLGMLGSVYNSTIHRTNEGPGDCCKECFLSSQCSWLSFWLLASAHITQALLV